MTAFLNEPSSLQSQQQQESRRPRLRTMFSSSICGMFEDNTDRSSRTDACALACFGVWLWERNEFLLRGKKPIPWTKRPLLIFLVAFPILVLLVLSVLGELLVQVIDAESEGHLNHSQEQEDQEALLMPIVWIIRISPWIWTMVLLIVCTRFQDSRARMRTELAAQEFFRRNDPQHRPQMERGNQDLNQTSIDATSPTQYQMNDFTAEHGWQDQQVHSFCACVPKDITEEEEFLAEQHDMAMIEKEKYDFCTRLWKLLASCCCGWLCGFWCVCCGMCAIAQEHRHLQHHHRQLMNYDYITFQPWSDYHRKTTWLRTTNVRNIVAHIRAMSILSTRLLSVTVLFLIFVTTITFVPYIQLLEIEQYWLLLATLAEPVVILYFVYWLYHRMDISLDAVIKYFAAGFAICTTMTLVYELIVSSLTSLTIFLVGVGAIFVDVETGSASVTYEGEEGYNYVNSNYDDFFSLENENYKEQEEGEPQLQLPESFFIGMSILSGFLNAFVVAGLIEELCKYLSFWMLEHPDFITDHNHSEQVVGGEEEDGMSTFSMNLDDEGATGIPTITTTGPTTNLSQQYVHAHHDDDAASVSTSVSVATTATASTPPVMSYESRGAAITIGMVATALGFACAEDLLYVFVYSAPGAQEGMETLLMRSLFPVHPLCAALQSLGVVRRDLEKDPLVRLGRIILPALLLHGSFDFVLMAISTYHEMEDEYDTSTTSGGWDDAVGTDDAFPSWEEEADPFPILLACLGMVFFGMFYFLQQASAQRERLKELDIQAKANGISTFHTNSHPSMVTSTVPSDRSNIVSSDDLDTIPVHSSVPS